MLRGSNLLERESPVVELLIEKMDLELVVLSTLGLLAPVRQADASHVVFVHRTWSLASDLRFMKPTHVQRVASQVNVMIYWFPQISLVSLPLRSVHTR